MPLVPAICTQCGSRLEIDSAKEAAICPYCNTPFVTEKAINHYNTTNVINAGVVNVSDSSSVENRVKAGDTFIKLGDYDSANTVFSKLSTEHPYDYRGWWGLIRVITKDFTSTLMSQSTLDHIEELYRKACVVASPEDVQTMETLFKEYCTVVRAHQDEFIRSVEKEIQQLTDSHQNSTRWLREQIDTLNTERNKMSKAFIGCIIAAIIIFVIGLAIGMDGVSVVLGIVAVVIFLIGRAINKKKPEQIDRKLYPLAEQLRTATGQYEARLRELQSRISAIKS